MDIAQLGLEIRSDGVVVARDRLRGFEGQAGRTERATGHLTRAFRLLAPVVGAVTAAFSVRALMQYADAWSDMQSRVGAAIKDMEAAPALMERMVDLANASYSPLSQTVDVYARNVGVLRDLGYAAEGTADFTEALNHALVITATRGERATAVQNALSKAMAVGQLQADGLETILANGGRVAEALADELGTTVSGLRAMASQGRITGDVIARALTGRLEELRAEAAEMPATMGDAFTRIQNNMTAFVGTLDQTYNISGRVAESMLGMADAILAATEPTIALVGALAENMDRLLYYGTAVGTYFALGWVASFVTAANVTALLTAGLGFLRVAIIRLGIGALLVLIGELVYQFMNLVEKTGGVGQAFNLLWEVAVGVWNGIVTSARAIPVGLNAVWLEVQAGFLVMLQQIQAAWNDFLSTFEQPALTVTIGGQTHELIGGIDLSRWRADLDATGAAAGRLRERASELRDVAAELSRQGNSEQLAALERLVNVASGANMDGIGAGAAFSELQRFLNAGEANLPQTATAIDGVGGALTAANDNAAALGETLAGVATFGDLLRDSFSGLGSGFWNALRRGESLLDVLLNKFDALVGKLLDNTFDNLLFGSGAGMGGGGLWGLLSGLLVPGFSNGGAGIVGGSGSYVPGAPDNTLFVARAQKGEPFAFGRQALTGIGGAVNSNVAQVTIQNHYTISGTMTDKDVANMVRAANRQTAEQVENSIKHKLPGWQTNVQIHGAA